MASETALVARKLGEAKETHQLDLSNCKLTKVPDAVYFLLKDTSILSCNLSDNQLTKIPTKFFTKLQSIQDLDLSNNKLTSLPTEIGQLKDLKRLNLSNNSLQVIPDCIYDCVCYLQELNLRGNSISAVDVDRLKASQTLTSLDLQDNSLSDDSKANLSANCKFIML